MTRALSPIRQQTEIAEGLAVGCLVIGVAAVGCDDEPVDAALSAALASWSWAARYPAFTSDAPTSLGPALRKSENRRPRRAAHWIVSRGLYVPQLRTTSGTWALPAWRSETTPSSRPGSGRPWPPPSSTGSGTTASGATRRPGSTRPSGPWTSVVDVSERATGLGVRGLRSGR